MARDGSNIYSAPAGTLAVSGTTIESAKYNAFVNDLVADANLPRPIVAGGTGVSTAGGWLAAMGVTATAAEINTLDGITATVAELNVLDGIPGTLTATEIGHLDGVTSAIQTQLNAKQATITTLPLANGGTGVALADPGADRLMFWDDSAGATAYLTVGASLSITGTTLDATGGWTLVSSSATWTGGAQTISDLSGYSRVMIVGSRLVADTADYRRLRVGTGGSLLTTNIYGVVNGLQAGLEMSSGNTIERSFSCIIERFNTTDAAKPVLASTSAVVSSAPTHILSASVFDRIQVANQTGLITSGTLYVWGQV